MRPKQSDIKAFLAIEEYIAGHGYGPTLDEVGELLKLKSRTAVQLVLARLIALGWLDRDDGVARSIRIIQRPDDETMRPAD